MDSSKEAFSRFEMWKNSHTVLRLTAYVNGAEDHFIGSIYHVDFDEELVDFMVDATGPDDTRRALPPLCLTGADFRVERRRVEATGPGFGKVVFEKVRTV
jgi:hypothetical protein